MLNNLVSNHTTVYTRTNVEIESQLSLVKYSQLLFIFLMLSFTNSSGLLSILSAHWHHHYYITGSVGLIFLYNSYKTNVDVK